MLVFYNCKSPSASSIKSIVVLQFVQTNFCFKTTWSDESKDCDSTEKSVSSEGQA